jgi:hypothetical protein
MNGTITIIFPTPQTPPPVKFQVTGDLTLVRTVDQPGINRVSVTLSSNNKQCALVIEGPDYTALCQKWATDADLINFIAQKFSLTA